MHYHLLGIAGTAMGSLAGLLTVKGHHVTGSDEGVYPPMSTQLDDLGIGYSRRFDPTHLEPPPDVVVVGNAISRGNVELEAILDRGLAYTSAPAVLREEFLRGRHVLAVAGTHGKTTTSALLAWLLESAGLSPSFLVGGVCENFGSSFRLTDSEFFVIEADEYDTAFFDKGPKMWHYLPRTAVLTNVEFDHADIYRDEVAYRFAFERFVNLVPRSGTLVAGWASRIVRQLAGASFAPVQSFYVGDGAVSQGPGEAGGDDMRLAAPETEPRWRATEIEVNEDSTTFTLTHDGGRLGRVKVPLIGLYNVENALAAIAAGSSVGMGFQAISEGLRTFRSVRRRMEIRGEVGGATVIDDFAHHPTAVRVVIDAARVRFSGRRVVAVFEPRSYTAQRREFQDAYRDALGRADRVILAGLFHPERYDELTGMDPEDLVASIQAEGVPAAYVPEVDRIVELLVSETKPGDVILLLSNGGFGGIHANLLERLSEGGGLRPTETTPSA